MDITGTLKVKNEAVQVSEKFTKREFVITLEGEYPQDILFQLTQDKCGLLNQWNIGDELKVYFNLRGRGWENKQGETKYFNSLDCWKIEGDKYSTEPEPLKQPPKTEDDLPF